MDYVALVMLLAVLEYMVLGALVGRARAKHGIRAPAVSGNAVFERCFRVHQNTLEGLVIFLPGLWIFGRYVSPTWAAALGLVGIVGRAIYAKGYMADAAKRGPGALICGLVNAVLITGSLIGVIASLF